MDQLKTILRQLLKQRFWIAVGVAALLPLGAYFAAAGSLNADTDKKIGEIVGEHKKVLGFLSAPVPNNQHLEIIAEKAAVLKGEVDKTWRTLYDRQAPLMTWPETVADKFPAWGRAWPKDVDNNLVQEGISEYVNALPSEVDKVYATFHPFDFKEGTGIVTAPLKEDLLRTPEFDFKNPPTLKQIWDIQQRLWLQRSLLEVVAEVNNKAKDWDSAPIKQITLLDVASITAQDQPSATSKDSKLNKSEDIRSDSAPPVVDASKSATGTGSMGMSTSTSGEAGTPGSIEEFYSIAAPGGQFQLYPVAIGVLMDQARIQEFLAALQASPVVVQVKDLNVQRPTSHVQKPAKDAENNFANMAGLDGVRGSYGTSRAMIFNPQMSPGSYSGSSVRSMTIAQPPPYGSGTMFSAGKTDTPRKPERKGVDLRGLDADKDKKAEALAQKDAEANAKAEPPDPYYDVVHVTIYGLARFYNKPPDPPAATSDSGTKPEAAPGAVGTTPTADMEEKEKVKDKETDKADAPKAEDQNAKPAGDKDAAHDGKEGKGQENAESKNANANANKADRRSAPAMDEGDDANDEDAAPAPAPKAKTAISPKAPKGEARPSRKSRTDR